MAGMNRANSDLMGMLGTVINALALQDAIETHGRPTRVLSAIGMDQVAEPYIRRRAVRHLEKGRVVIFAAGMGNPYFTNRHARRPTAAEIEADIVLKGTHGGSTASIRGSAVNPKAPKSKSCSFDEVISRDFASWI